MSGDRVARDRGRILAARARGRGALLRTYVGLSGPGWLQSAITLGGGSLAGGLYLGVLTGFSLLWLQPLAMLMGVVMLSGISYATLSTGKAPFRAINEHINPVLGWGWAAATLAANVVWALPQFALGTAAVQQNLFPSLAGDTGKVVVCAVMLGTSIAVIWFYDSGARGIRIFEGVLKAMVAVIVLSFMGVVVVMSAGGALDWGAIARGFVPDLSLLSHPASAFDGALAAVTGSARDFWVDHIVSHQRDVMVTAAATAVGINMTFLLPYTMLARGWDREFRGLATFDLATGLLVPFGIATGCVVIASAAQFHARPDDALIARSADCSAGLVARYDGLLSLRAEEVGEVVSSGDEALASMLANRDAFDLADSLTPLAGEGVAQYVFGVGVLGMALSTVIILMLISGFTLCEMLGLPPRGRARRLASLLPALGVLGPFVWQGDAKFWLAVPTSVFGMMLLPIAYVTFFLMMNSRGLLGADLPRGARRLTWNGLMLISLAFATFGACWVVWSKAGWVGVLAAGVFLGAAGFVHVARSSRSRR